MVSMTLVICLANTLVLVCYMYSHIDFFFFFFFQICGVLRNAIYFNLMFLN